MPYVFAALTLAFACAYAFVRRGGKLSNRIFCKTAASVSFVMLAVSLQLKGQEPYFTLVLAGLCFSFAGDVLLLFAGRSLVFLTWGAVCFFLTHAVYTAAFITKAPLGVYDAAMFLALVLLAALLGLHGKRIKKLKSGAVIYALALCAMLARALSMLFAAEVGIGFAACVALGGALFAVSDSLLAFESLGNPYAKFAGTVSVLIYYSSQLLIALSIAL